MPLNWIFDVPADGDGQQHYQQPELEALKVMVADDDRDSYIHAALLLKNLGIVSDWALTGEEGIEKVHLAQQVGGGFLTYVSSIGRCRISTASR